MLKSISLVEKMK